MRRPDPLQSLLAFCVLSLSIAAASAAQAHCCHDSRTLGIAQQSELRRGLHGAEGGLTDESIHAQPPGVGRGLGDRDDRNQGVGGYGTLRGNNVGNYGAGSLGQRGPGGLGAMTGSGLNSGPVEPR